MATLTTEDLRSLLIDCGVAVPKFDDGLPAGHRMLELHDDFVAGLRCLGIDVDESKSGWDKPLMVVRLNPKTPEQRLAVGAYSASGGLVGCLADDEYYWHDSAACMLPEWDFKLTLCDEAAAIGPLLPHLAVPVWAAPLPPGRFEPERSQELLKPRCLYAGKPKTDRQTAVAQFGGAVEWLEVPKPHYEQAVCTSATVLFLNSKSHYGCVTPRLKECLMGSVTLLPDNCYSLRYESETRYSNSWTLGVWLDWAKVATETDIRSKVFEVSTWSELRQRMLIRQQEFLERYLLIERDRWLYN